MTDNAGVQAGVGGQAASDDAAGRQAGGAEPNAEAVVDMSAIEHNVATIVDRVDAEVMAVVKADGFGHGLVPVARAALDVDVSAASAEHLYGIADAARLRGRPAQVHLKVDTGMSRNGAAPDEWPQVV